MNLWDMCKSTHDVAHQALVMSQDTRARQNEFFAAKNYPYPAPGAELNPVPYVNYVMPPINDDTQASDDLMCLASLTYRF
jgi:hypothetical protein